LRHAVSASLSRGKVKIRQRLLICWFFRMVNISLIGGHPMFKSSLKISLIAFALALVALPLSAATLVALTLF
jgi:hypothetical protein